uniref:SLC12A transporter C-terminal domain-containing protein n=1 Tax=Panagrolaimus davidi TaxID=227884 RepID=A0A914QA21_9BILA
MIEAEKKQSIVSMNPAPESVVVVERNNTVSGSESDSDISLSGLDMIRLAKHFNPDQIQILTAINRFQFKVSKGTIDVWWLYDDGGLSLLIPYLLTQRKSYLEGAKLRIFTLSSQSKIIEDEQRKLAALLSKFRINFAEVRVIKDDGRKPNIESILEFEKLIEPFCVDSDMPDPPKEGLIQESELLLNQEKTWRTLRMAENLQKYSSESDLIVVTLPVPRKGLISSCLYMAWIDMMTKNLPPTLLVRGNQTSVLTFYS